MEEELPVCFQPVSLLCRSSIQFVLSPTLADQPLCMGDASTRWLAFPPQKSVAQTHGGSSSFELRN